MLIIIDDVVSNPSFQSDCIKLSETEKNISEKWYSLDEEHIFQNFCIQMINMASQMYDFTSCIGYEFWTRLNTCVEGWHRDRDEKLYERENVLSYPLCTILYYPHVKNLTGGQLLLEDDIIMPRTNRMIIFSSGMSHNVRDFTGERTAMIINPRSKKL